VKENTPMKAANVLLSAMAKETTDEERGKPDPRKDDDFTKEAECCTIL
jgi:hypothetical protein